MAHKKFACFKKNCEWLTKINDNEGFCMLISCPYKKCYRWGGKSKNDTKGTEQTKKQS